MHEHDDTLRRPLDGLREWAHRAPNRTAVTDGRVSITYGELLETVQATAGAARAALRSAPTGAYLPVLVDRSTRSAAAVLACVLGRVRFLPVDANASPELLRSLVARAGAADFYLRGAARDTSFAGLVALDVTRSTTRMERAGEPDADEPGLLLFSSGTTGEPKGIVLSWQTVEDRWRSRDAEYDAEGFGPGDDRRQPLVIPMDSSWGIAKLLDVASGFAEQVVDVSRVRPVDVLSRMAQFAPTAVAIPAQLARVFAQMPGSLTHPLPTVRRLHIAAEGFRYEHLDGLREIFSAQTTVVHSLASSEGGREIAGTFTLGRAPASGALHLGRPLFPHLLRVVPAPVHGSDVGEVHVGGAIANEYLDDPELTAERFYADADGRRWWRSHDLVTYDEETEKYLHGGRMDDAVKVRGKLASPSDITTILLGIDGVAGAITVPVETEGASRLVAHVEIEDGSAVQLDGLRRALAARLPAHAVPSAIMRHAQLPVNVRGKVDRAALMEGPFVPW
jgi:acyl-CoA synthetase (AMP-forming)/AMP-acid ligase II